MGKRRRANGRVRLPRRCIAPVSAHSARAISSSLSGPGGRRDANSRATFAYRASSYLRDSARFERGRLIIALLCPAGKPPPARFKLDLGSDATVVSDRVLQAGSAPVGQILMELLAFPNGANDDQVDSVSQLLLWMQRSVARTGFHGFGAIGLLCRRFGIARRPRNVA
jgi:hypothetical protein